MPHEPAQATEPVSPDFPASGPAFAELNTPHPVPGTRYSPDKLDEGAYLRRATLADVPALHAIERELFLYDAWSSEIFDAEISHPTRTYLALISGGEEIVGYCGVMVVADTADIQTIAVHPAYEGRGYGRAMLEAAESIARERGGRRIMLEVRADNPRAQRLYRRNGYVHLHTRRGYYEDGTDALIMCYELHEPTKDSQQ